MEFPLPGVKEISEQLDEVIAAIGDAALPRAAE